LGSEGQEVSQEDAYEEAAKEFEIVLRRDMNEKMLDMLEALLFLTEQFKEHMECEDLETWQRISAEVADMRDGEEV
jgi:hypothetical protein